MPQFLVVTCPATHSATVHRRTLAQVVMVLGSGTPSSLQMVSNSGRRLRPLPLRSHNRYPTLRPRSGTRSSPLMMSWQQQGLQATKAKHQTSLRKLWVPSIAFSSLGQAREVQHPHTPTRPRRQTLRQHTARSDPQGPQEAHRWLRRRGSEVFRHRWAGHSIPRLHGSSGRSTQSRLSLLTRV